MVNMVNKSLSTQICGYFPNYSHRQTCSKTSFTRVNSTYNPAVRHFELKVSSHVTTRCFGQTSSAAHGAGLEENLNIPAGLSHGYIHACPVASSSHIFLPGVTSCFHMGNFLAQQENLLVPGQPHRTFFEPCCIRWFCTAHLLLRITRWPPWKRACNLSININKMKLTAEEKRY